MATLHDALSAVTAGIEAALAAASGGPPPDVDQHPGRFTEAELGALVLKKRAVRVAIEAVPQVQVTGPGAIQAQLLLSAFVICGDTLTAPRHQAALALVHQLLQAIPHQRWGTSYLRPALPASLQVDNLYGGEIGSRGVALWAISWQQGFIDHH